MMLPLRLMVTAEVVLHVGVCGCRPVKDTRPLASCPLPLKAKLIARVLAEVPHLVLPKGLCVRLRPAGDDECSSVATAMELEQGALRDLDAQFVEELSSA
eukprot:57182-Eustigmatos_ZCMA.PRE.1